MKPVLALAACFGLIALELSACAGKKRDFADGPYQTEPSASAERAGPAGTASGDAALDEGGADGALGLSPPGEGILGTACVRDMECASGFCTDGVCCDTRCADLCATCGAPALAMD